MIKKTNFFTIFAALFIWQSAVAGNDEDYAWWNAYHKWDGCSVWTSYLKTSAAYFGPNALPVPRMNEGLISSKYTFETGPEAHLSAGDKTYDLYTSLRIPLGERVDFEIFIVPFEYFTMDTATRNERAVRHIDATGWAGGDFWFGTNFTVLKEKKHRPSLTASFYFKTASGTDLDYARYTDSEGYYINISAGKEVWKDEKLSRKLRIFGQAGFYSYNTWDYLHNQDDCIIYGIGAKYTTAKFRYRAALSGYWGYLNNGDRPSVLRLQAGTNFKTWNLALKYQLGIHDFNYNTIGLSLLLSI